jgi:hypothetical protein
MITTRPKEFDFLNSGESTKKRLDQGWGVSPISMGEIEESSRASAAVADDHLTMNVLNPRLSMFSEIMSRHLPPFFSGRKAEVVYLEEAHSKDMDYDLALEQAMVDRGGMALNEWRERHGLTRLHKGDKSMVQGQWIDVLDEEAMKRRRQEHRNKPPREPNPPGGGPKDKAGSIASQIGFKAVVDRHSKMNDTFEKKLHRVIEKALGELGAYTSGRLSKHGETPSLEEIIGAVDKHQWMHVLKKAAEPVLYEAALSGASHEFVLSSSVREVSGIMTKSWIPDTIRKRVQSFVTGFLKMPLWGKMVDTVIKAARSAVMEGGLQKAKDVLTDPDKIKDRASGIASVESLAAVSGGRHVAYKYMVEKGFVRGRKWVTMHDDKVRSTHQHLDNKVAYGDSLFHCGDEYCSYPGDPTLSAKNRCNCRCVLVTI